MHQRARGSEDFHRLAGRLLGCGQVVLPHEDRRQFHRGVTDVRIERAGEAAEQLARTLQAVVLQ